MADPRSIHQHSQELKANREHWKNKPLLRVIYGGFYRRILECLDPAVPGRILELGSGLGLLKDYLPEALCSDLFPDPRLDLVCDGYEIPFADHSLSHLILFDVFHHLQAPRVFLNEARRVLAENGRLVLFEPHVSWISYPVYAWLHHEGAGWNKPLERASSIPRPRSYFTAQGNATRLFFRKEAAEILDGWRVDRAQAFASFSYLGSGGFSRPAVYPARCLPLLEVLDRWFSRFPTLFGARCLIVLSRKAAL